MANQNTVALRPCLYPRVFRELVSKTKWHYEHGPLNRQLLKDNPHKRLTCASDCTALVVYAFRIELLDTRSTIWHLTDTVNTICAIVPKTVVHVNSEQPFCGTVIRFEKFDIVVGDTATEARDDLVIYLRPLVVQVLERAPPTNLPHVACAVHLQPNVKTLARELRRWRSKLPKQNNLPRATVITGATPTRGKLLQLNEANTFDKSTNMGQFVHNFDDVSAVKPPASMGGDEQWADLITHGYGKDSRGFRIPKIQEAVLCWYPPEPGQSNPFPNLPRNDFDKAALYADRPDQFSGNSNASSECTEKYDCEERVDLLQHAEKGDYSVSQMGDDTDENVAHAQRSRRRTESPDEAVVNSSQWSASSASGTSSCDALPIRNGSLPPDSDEEVNDQLASLFSPTQGASRESSSGNVEDLETNRIHEFPGRGDTENPANFSVLSATVNLPTQPSAFTDELHLFQQVNPVKINTGVYGDCGDAHDDFHSLSAGERSKILVAEDDPDYDSNVPEGYASEANGLQMQLKDAVTVSQKNHIQRLIEAAQEDRANLKSFNEKLQDIKKLRSSCSATRQADDMISPAKKLDSKDSIITIDSDGDLSRGYLDLEMRDSGFLGDAQLTSGDQNQDPPYWPTIQVGRNSGPEDALSGRQTGLISQLSAPVNLDDQLASHGRQLSLTESSSSTHPRSVPSSAKAHHSQNFSHGDVLRANGNSVNQSSRQLLEGASNNHFTIGDDHIVASEVLESASCIGPRHQTHHSRSISIESATGPKRAFEERPVHASPPRKKAKFMKSRSASIQLSQELSDFRQDPSEIAEHSPEFFQTDLMKDPRALNIQGEDSPRTPTPHFWQSPLPTVSQRKISGKSPDDHGAQISSRKSTSPVGGPKVRNSDKLSPTPRDEHFAGERLVVSMDSLPKFGAAEPVAEKAGGNNVAFHHSQYSLLYDTFRSAYSDWSGDVAYFEALCQMVVANKIMRNFCDDFVYLHNMKYLPEMMVRLRSFGDIKPYEEWFEDEVEATTCKQRIIDPKNLRELCLKGRASSSECTNQAAQGLAYDTLHKTAKSPVKPNIAELKDTVPETPSRVGRTHHGAPTPLREAALQSLPLSPSPQMVDLTSSRSSEAESGMGLQRSSSSRLSLPWNRKVGRLGASEEHGPDAQRDSPFTPSTRFQATARRSPLIHRSARLENAQPHQPTSPRCQPAAVPALMSARTRPEKRPPAARDKPLRPMTAALADYGSAQVANPCLRDGTSHFARFVRDKNASKTGSGGSWLKEKKKPREAQHLNLEAG